MPLLTPPAAAVPLLTPLRVPCAVAATAGVRRAGRAARARAAPRAKAAPLERAVCCGRSALIEGVMSATSTTRRDARELWHARWPRGLLAPLPRQAGGNGGTRSARACRPHAGQSLPACAPAAAPRRKRERKQIWRAPPARSRIRAALLATRFRFDMPRVPHTPANERAHACRSRVPPTCQKQGRAGARRAHANEGARATIKFTAVRTPPGTAARGARAGRAHACARTMGHTTRTGTRTPVARAPLG